MERRRLRPTHSESDLRRIYGKTHNHAKWADHRLRVQVTAQMARWLADGVNSAADLSCGDGVILSAIDCDVKIYGDLAAGYEIQGPIEQTLETIPKVGLFICAETVEHLDDPDTVLVDIRDKCDRLVLSTPVEAWSDANVEHYWAWSRSGVETMLGAAGFRIRAYNELDTRMLSRAGYRYGIWACV